MTAADPRDGLHGLVAKWRDPESPPLNQDQLRQAIRNGARLDCADELEQALAHARPEAVDYKAALQAAVDGIEVPKMTAARAEYYKAGARAAIAAMNAALPPERAP